MFTFSKTLQTASRGVVLSRVMTGITYPVSRVEDLILEPVPKLVLLGPYAVALEVLLVPFRALGAVEHKVGGKHELLDLALTTREVEDDLAADVLGDDALIRYGDDRILAVFLRIETFAHIKVVEATELLAALVRGADGIFFRKASSTAR